MFSQKQKPWMLGPFERGEDARPILQKDSFSVFTDPLLGKNVHWESMATFNPAAVVRNDSIYVLYRAEEKLGEKEIGGHRSRIGMAMSPDGQVFTKSEAPVFHPERDDQQKHEWPGGTEDPRIVETQQGLYVMTYTQWDRKIPRLAVATSKDLLHWEKHGPVFQKYREGHYHGTETKSGAIVTQLKDGRLVAAKIQGKYWMYYGVPQIKLASSTDLVDWVPLEDHQGTDVTVLGPRPGHFDSWLVEPGPPPLLTEDGIVLLYNAGNSQKIGLEELGNRVYTGGQALFDPQRPWKLLDRTDQPFIKPELPFEKSGQYPEGTTFLEGLVLFRGQWLLFYGTADSMVALVRANQ